MHLHSNTATTNSNVHFSTHYRQACLQTGSQDPLPCLHLNINLLGGKMVGENVQEHMELMREAKRRKKKHTSHINESRGNAVEDEEGVASL
jgi:hypothetical protein